MSQKIKKKYFISKCQMDISMDGVKTIEIHVLGILLEGKYYTA